MATAYAWGNQGFNTPTAAQQNYPTPTPNRDISEESTNTLARNLLTGLQLCLLAVLGLVIWLNIQPYIGMMNELLGNQGRHPLVIFIMSLPGIGWLLGFIKSIFLSVLGILLWGLFQIIELMPSIINSNNGLKNMLFGLSQHRRIQVNQGDPLLVKQMKVKYNCKPQTWMRKAVLAASVAYLVDFAFCLFYYPPINGGMQNLSTFLLAPSADQIDFRNLTLALVTLFSVELAVWIFMWMLEGKNYLLGERGQQ